MLCVWPFLEGNNLSKSGGTARRGRGRPKVAKDDLHDWSWVQGFNRFQCLFCCKTTKSLGANKFHRCSFAGCVNSCRILQQSHPSHKLFRLQGSGRSPLYFCVSCGAFTSFNNVRLRGECDPFPPVGCRASDRCRAGKMKNLRHPTENFTYDTIERVRPFYRSSALSKEPSLAADLVASANRHLADWITSQ